MMERHRINQNWGIHSASREVKGKKTYVLFIFCGKPVKGGLKSCGFANHAFEEEGRRICFVLQQLGKLSSRCNKKYRNWLYNLRKKGKGDGRKIVPMNYHHSRCFFTRPSTRFWNPNFSSREEEDAYLESLKAARMLERLVSLMLCSWNVIHVEKDRQHK